MNANNSNSSNISPAKKRKANDGHAAATDGAHDVSTGNTNDGGGFLSSWFGYFSGRRDVASSGSPSNENLLHQSLSQINATMMRMEEKLSIVSNLESKCEQLERKCSSLENMLESTKEHIDNKFEHIDKKIDSLDFDLDQKCDAIADRLETIVDVVEKQEDKALKRHEFNEMMLKNQSWEYSAPVLSANDLVFNGCTDNEVEYLMAAEKALKDATTKMRRGELTDERRVHVSITESYPPFSYDVNNELLPHWKEFALALDQFTPAINLLPDDSESSFTFYCVQMNLVVMHLVKKALMGKPFQSLQFINNNEEDDERHHRGMSVDAILDIVESNKHLRKLDIYRHQISNHHIERLCSAVRNHPLVQLELHNGFEAADCREMLASLLTIDDLTLETLVMSRNGIASAVSNLLADFLATNPRLKELNICENNLNDSDAELIANALRNNTTLRWLNLEGNDITDAGVDALGRVLWDYGSLNASADTNHVCSIDFGYVSADWNSHEEKEINRGWKIYYLLSSRHKTMSNVQYFGDIDVKILPNMIEAVQKCHDASAEYDLTTEIMISEVGPLSIVYEIMRKWDKVFPLYKSLGIESSENE